jgi:hypothetical protein
MNRNSMSAIKSKARRFWPLTSRVLRPLAITDIGGLVELPQGFWPTNPGLVRHGEGYLSCVRGVNYIYKSRRSLRMEFTAGEHHRTVNRFVRLDVHLRPVASYDALDRHFDDYEDIRLFLHQGRTYGVANVAAADGNRMVLIKFAEDLRDAEIEPLASPFALRREKNWCPFSDGRDIFFVHSFEPGSVFKYVPGQARLAWVPNGHGHEPAPPASFLECGSTPGVAYANHQLFVTHRRSFRIHHLDYVYSSRLCTLSSDLCELGRGTYFSMGPHGIQFVSGLVVSAERALVAYGVNDRRALVATFELGALLDELAPSRLRRELRRLRPDQQANHEPMDVRI